MNTATTTPLTEAQSAFLRLAPEIFYCDGERPEGASPSEAAAWCDANRDFLREQGVYVTVKNSERAPVTNVICRNDHYIGDGDSYYGVYTFDPATERFDHVTIGSTYNYSDLRPTVPASPEVREHAARVCAHYTREKKLDEIAERAHAVERGREVKVDAPRARNRPRSGEGKVFWIGADRFSRYGGTRIGVELNDGTKGFYSADEVEVLHPEDHIDYEQVRFLMHDESFDAERFDIGNAVWRRRKEDEAAAAREAEAAKAYTRSEELAALVKEVVR